MDTPKTWGLQLTGPRSIAYFLLGAVASLVVVVVSVLLGVGSVWPVTEGVLDLLELWALVLSVGLAARQPPSFSATRSVRTDADSRTLRTGAAALFEICAAALAAVAYVGLVLSIEGNRGYSTTLGEFLFGLEQTVWFNGPVSLLVLCCAVFLYLVSYVLN